MLDGYRIKETSKEEKLKAIEAMQINLNMDKNELKANNRLSLKTLRFIDNEKAKLEMDTCFINCDALNINTFLKFIKEAPIKSDKPDKDKIIKLF